MSEGIRLQKVLAQAGVASRRGCEELMASGRVEVDGNSDLAMGVRVDPDVAIIRVDGKRIPPPSDFAYLAFNKPRGVVSTMSDEHGRRDLSSFVKTRPERLFHVGRLDTDTSGLLIFTNHGDFAHRLAHPSYEVTKTYVAVVHGRADDGLSRRLLSGIDLDDGRAAADRFQIKDLGKERSLVELDIHIGRNRIVRRLLDAAGHPVIDLTRTAFGSVRLGELKPGAIRALSRDELGGLFDSVGL